MSVLLLGADGQLGRSLRHALAPAGPLLAVGRRGHGPWDGELAHREGLATLLHAVRPRVIVNAAAWTDVDGAQSHPQEAFAANALACATLAEAARSMDAWLIHYSTDYVFDGSGERPWREDDAPAPLNVYGASKLAGEEAVRAGCDRHLVLRTSWVFEAGGRNFVQAILDAARTRDRLEVVDDQWGAPTRADWLAQATAELIRRPAGLVPGLFHLTSAGFTSRYQLARHILDRARKAGLALRLAPGGLVPVPTREQPGRAPRPLNSRLDTHRIQAVYGLVPPPWTGGVDAVVDVLSRQVPPVE